MVPDKKSRESKYDYRIERLLFKGVLFGMLILIFFQCIMLKEPVRIFLNYAMTLEGIPLEESGMVSKKGSLHLRLEEGGPCAETKLLLNGEPAAAFDVQEVKIIVRNNDILELDATGNKDKFVYIRVVGVSDNVTGPPVGLQIRAKNRIELISRVKLK